MIEIKRETKETSINLVLDDDINKTKIDTKVNFLNHLLETMAFYANVGLVIEAVDYDEYDDHHIVEDVAICLGMALNEKVDEIRYFNRFGQCLMPMDDALTLVALDISNRSYLNYDVTFSNERIKEFDVELIEEFFQALVRYFRITLHIKNMYFKNNHHLAESIFKGFGLALREAMKTNENNQVFSTKKTM